MRIPFITPIACVWHYPVYVQKKVDHPDFAGFMAMMAGRGEDWQQKASEPRYEETGFVHWKPARSPDDLPPDISVRDIKIASLRTRPLVREIFVLGNENAIIHQQNHTWMYSIVPERGRYMRGIVAGITRRPWIAERWLATGNTTGLRTIELPEEAQS